MQEMNPLEKQLQSWTPRRSSAKLGRKLFAKAAPAPAFLRRADVWNWLTPAAACVLTLMIVVNSSSRRLPQSSNAENDNAGSFATLMFRVANSNMQQTFVLNKLDENLEWNVWSHPFPTQTVRVGWNAMPTNH